MGQKKRKRNLTVYGSYEGDREELFLKFLIDLYKPKDNGINITPRTAGRIQLAISRFRLYPRAKPATGDGVVRSRPRLRYYLIQLRTDDFKRTYSRAFTGIATEISIKRRRY